jgi:hypothetical protein
LHRAFVAARRTTWSGSGRHRDRHRRAPGRRTCSRTRAPSPATRSQGRRHRRSGAGKAGELGVIRGELFERSERVGDQGCVDRPDRRRIRGCRGPHRDGLGSVVSHMAQPIEQLLAQGSVDLPPRHQRALCAQACAPPEAPRSFHLRLGDRAASGSTDYCVIGGSKRTPTSCGGTTGRTSGRRRGRSSPGPRKRRRRDRPIDRAAGRRSGSRPPVRGLGRPGCSHRAGTGR